MARWATDKMTSAILTPAVQNGRGFMYNVLVMATQDDADPLLLQRLEEEGIGYTVVPNVEALTDDGTASAVDAVLVDMGACSYEALSPAVERCQELRVPLLCGLPARQLVEYDIAWGATDFFILPTPTGEITARVRQAQQRNHRPTGEAGEKALQVGDLRIDMERYEVFNRRRRVLLTFKEYQLLCVLASNPGHVYTREALLNQIWEYDYFGGTRTVDVHIRRLRSKIEDTGHTYIETVWNVGYRFRS